MGCGASKKKEPAPPPPAADAAPAGYQPFKRGPFPVGVRTIKLTDSARTSRVLPVEVYYPAAEAVRGLDISKQDVFLPMESMPLKLANEVIQRALSQAAVRDAPHCEGPAATLFPAVLLCHAEFQHRRASSYLTTHLASHGFIVFTWDCPGDTAEDLVFDSREEYKNQPRRIRNPEWRFDDRVADFSFVYRTLAGEVGTFKALVKPDCAIAMGHGVGAAAAVTWCKGNAFVKACFAMAPTLGLAPLRNDPMYEVMNTQVTRPVPIFYLCAKGDAFTPFDDRVRGFFKAHCESAAKFVPPPLTKLVAMDKCGYFHFLAEPAEAHDAALRPTWPVLKVPGLNQDPKALPQGAGYCNEYLRVVAGGTPFATLLPPANVHAVIVTLCTSFLHSEVSEREDATDMLYKVLTAKLYNVDLEIVSA